MITTALQFLLQTILGLFALTALLRFYLQLTNAPFQNPVSQLVVALTNFIVIPTRRFIPSWRGFDLSTLLLAYAAELLIKLGLLWLGDFPLMLAGNLIWVAIFGLALVEVLKLSIYIFLYATILQAILSWVNPYSPVAPVLDALTRPLLKPLRKRIPLAGGFDLTPIIVFIVAQLLLLVFISPLEIYFSRLY
ncbi:osmotic-shock protein [Methylovorus sp. MM2]|uniref:YggT family protein n=1 Tax=Methylovorus sp. MM2 TaxID=1848038 RepID=UPI0007DFC17A|nr:YggT family protein [Methylovorus sp. MM2]OAM51380.1 osmotic-shock protein [Methylovorus sp. MM2]